MKTEEYNAKVARGEIVPRKQSKGKRKNKFQKSEFRNKKQRTEENQAEESSTYNGKYVTS